MKLMGFLLQVRQKLQLLFLDSQIKVRLLECEHDLSQHQVLPILERLRLRLRESSQEEYVQFQCSYVQVVALHEVKVLELSLHVA